MPPRTTRHEEDAPAVAVVPEPVTATTRQPPTLTEAFTVLREALAAHYQDDNIPAYLACQEWQMVYDNGNVAPAWRQLLVLLEQAVGQPIRIT